MVRSSPSTRDPQVRRSAHPSIPPAYYLGWPLANAAKRLGASLIDWVGFWVLAWFGMVAIGGTVSAVGGNGAGSVAVFPLLIVVYALGYYNVGLGQSRTGQSWGKRLLGLRLVKMNELRPPSKFDLTFRPLIGVVEILTGVGILSMLLSRYRQSFGDRFAGTVVIDEARAGRTLPWVIPGDPVIDPGPPVPQGGVPRPGRPRRSERVDPGPPPWTRPPAGAHPRPAPGLGDLPEREHGDHTPPPRPRQPQAPSGAGLIPPGTRVERDDITKLDIPNSTDEPGPRQAGSAPPRPSASGPQPPSSAPPPPELRYLTDPGIVHAIRVRDSASSHRRARACIEAAFERGEAVDVAEAIAEYRALIAANGVVINVSDDKVAGWLGLG